MDKGEVALGRWPTTIGGWKTIEKSDGSMALKYKESVTGDAIWPEILATPTWHPATGIPTRKLLIKRGDTQEPKTEIIGPGYRAAYGLVALVHHQIEGVDEHDELQLMDHQPLTRPLVFGLAFFEGQPWLAWPVLTFPWCSSIVSSLRREGRHSAAPR